MSISKTHQKMAHELIADTAKGLAAAFYEEAAKDNDFYKFYPKQKAFVNREWGRFVEAARNTLAQMLGRNDVPEWQKEQIHEALILHATLPGNIDKRVTNKVLNIMPNVYGVQ